MRAWITPDEASEDTRLISITVPDDTYLYSCLIGAIMLLCDAANWEPIGDMTPDEVVALFDVTWQDVVANA